MARTIDGSAGDAGAITAVSIPFDCTDGFSEAYSDRPEALLDPGARRANSAWSFMGTEVAERFETELQNDLGSGAWDAKHGHLRSQATFDGSLRLIVGLP